jgi:hypothetical protein
MRQDQWANTVTIDGTPMGVWDTLTGGDVEAEETKYKPGGMAPAMSLGGSVNVNNITLGRLLDRSDWDFMHNLMASRTGKAEVLVARQPLDADGNPFGRPLSYRGVLLHVEPGDTDSNSSDAQVWQITVSTEGSIG